MTESVHLASEAVAELEAAVDWYKRPIVVLAVAHQSRVPHYWTVRAPDEPEG